MINGYSLKDIRVRLLFEMRDGIYCNSNRLPRETELSEILGISRTQLRDVLSELEREGFITRRHGVGTVINHHVLQVKNRMDIETEFMDMIRQCGYEPGGVFYWSGGGNRRSIYCRKAGCCGGHGSAPLPKAVYCGW